MTYLLTLLTLALPSNQLLPLDPTITEPITLTLVLRIDDTIVGSVPFVTKPTRWAVIMDGGTYQGYYFQVILRDDVDDEVLKVGCIVAAPGKPDFTRKNQRFVATSEPALDAEGYYDGVCRAEQGPMT